HGADVNYRTPQGISAIMVAALEGDEETYRELVARGAQFDRADNTGRTPMHCAADSSNSGAREVVRDLLARGISPNLADNRGTTPLMEAAIAGNESVVEILLAAGADPGARNDRGKSALDLARENQSFEVMEQLDTELAGR